MLFNSIEFLLFFSASFFIYWALNKKLVAQNLFIVLISYLFYAWWSWKFLSLILITTASSYITGILINNSEQKRAKFWLLTNISINLLILGTFKYFNFFIESFSKVLETIGFTPDFPTLEIILPVGISFYTFQALAYSVDIYRKKISACRNPLVFCAFIAYFPQLLAGPIERASDLIPQLEKKRKFDYNQSVLGLRQVLWGLVKKIVIADNISPHIDSIFENPTANDGFTLVWAMAMFLVQLYCDYSGYTDIAIGVSKMLGIRLTDNFKFPLFARSVTEFWRRWNITLMNWLRDYIYIPLGGSRKGTKRYIINVLIVFFISGLWHGAAWVFIIWALANGLVMILERNRIKKQDTRTTPQLRDIPIMIGVFVIEMTLFFYAFYSGSFESFYSFIQHLFKISFVGHFAGITALLYIIPFIVIEWLGRKNSFALEIMPFKHRIIRMAIYWVLGLALIYSSTAPSQQYIYFQF